MKKKIKDLTVQELADFCEHHACPLCPLYTDSCELSHAPAYIKQYGAYEREIELPDAERAEQ